MISSNHPIEVGAEYIRDADGGSYRVEKVYGRGRNRQVRLDRTPPGCNWREVRMGRFRRFYTHKAQ